MTSIDVDWTRIIIGLVAFAVGYLFAMLDRRVTQSIRDKRKPEVEVVEKIVREESALSIVLDDNQQAEVRLDGEVVEAHSVTPDQRKYLIALLTRIRPLLEGKPAPASQATPPIQKPVVTPKPPIPAPQPASTPRPTQPPTKQTTTDIDPEADAPAGTSMVAQINAILKENIAETPLKNRGIFLMEMPGGGVSVYIGTTRHESIADVPDPEVKAAIQAAIAEWEEKYTPGD